MSPTVISAAPESFNHSPPIAKNIENPPITSIEAIAIALIFREIHRLVSQFLISGPSAAFSSNQACHFSEDLAKQAVATSRNGVVGSSGRKTPMAASARKRNPQNWYRLRASMGGAQSGEDRVKLWLGHRHHSEENTIVPTVSSITMGRSSCRSGARPASASRRKLTRNDTNTE